MEANSLQLLKNHILTRDQAPNASAVTAVGDNISVNFRPELKDIIKETKYLDKLSLSVPEAALNVALQEEKYYHLVENLNTMIRSYKAVMDPLDSSERKLFAVHINELRRVMKPGFTRLNWNSLGIPEFIQRCNMEINKLSSLVNQTRKNSSNIGRAIDQIANAVLLVEPPKTEIIDAHEYFDLINRHRSTVLDTMVASYKSIGPLLMKTESLVANTNTGNSKMLKEYYGFWEKKVFAGLTYVTLFLPVDGFE